MDNNVPTIAATPLEFGSRTEAKKAFIFIALLHSEQR